MFGGKLNRRRVLNSLVIVLMATHPLQYAYALDDLGLSLPSSVPIATSVPIAPLPPPVIVQTPVPNVSFVDTISAKLDGIAAQQQVDLNKNLNTMQTQVQQNYVAGEKEMDKRTASICAFTCGGSFGKTVQQRTPSAPAPTQNPGTVTSGNTTMIVGGQASATPQEQPGSQINLGNGSVNVNQFAPMDVGGGGAEGWANPGVMPVPTSLNTISMVVANQNLAQVPTSSPVSNAGVDSAAQDIISSSLAPIGAMGDMISQAGQVIPAVQTVADAGHIIQDMTISGQESASVLIGGFGEDTVQMDSPVPTSNGGTQAGRTFATAAGRAEVTVSDKVAEANAITDTSNLGDKSAQTVAQISKDVAIRTAVGTGMSTLTSSVAEMGESAALGTTVSRIVGPQIGFGIGITSTAIAKGDEMTGSDVASIATDVGIGTAIGVAVATMGVPGAIALGIDVAKNVVTGGQPTNNAGPQAEFDAMKAEFMKDPSISPTDATMLAHEAVRVKFGY